MSFFALAFTAETQRAQGGQWAATKGFFTTKDTKSTKDRKSGK